MKLFLRLIALVISILFVFLLAACNEREIISSVPPTEISWEEAREIAENKQAEFRVFFNDNRELLEDLQTQLLPLWDEAKLLTIFLMDSQIAATRRVGGEFDLGILAPQLMQQIELYFNLVGENNAPRINIDELTSERHHIVSFVFPLPNQVVVGIRYSPEFQPEHWERLEGNWFIFVDRLVIE